MKTLRQTCAATVLALALAVSALAGQIQCPGAPEPPPPGETSTPPSSMVGEIPTVNSTAPGDIPTIGLSLAMSLLELAF
jgi:hypothetical protein